MKPNYKKQIKEILRNFDFGYVCKAMGEDREQWGYFGNEYPQVDVLRGIARDLLEDAVTDPKRHTLTMTHGLMAMKWGDWLSLYFVPVMWEGS